MSFSRPSCFSQDAEKVRQRRSRIVQILNVAQRVRLRVLSLAAALLDELFEHPAVSFLYSRHKCLDQGGIESFALLLRGPAKDDNRHTKQGDSGSSPVEDGELLAVHDLQPDEGRCHVYTAIGSIDPSAGGGVEREEPDKGGEAERCRNQEPDRSVLAKPEVREKAADDFSKSRENEQSSGLDQEHRYVLLLMGDNVSSCMTRIKFEGSGKAIDNLEDAGSAQF